MVFTSEGSQVIERAFVANRAVVQESKPIANPLRFIEPVGGKQNRFASLLEQLDELEYGLT